MIEGECGMFKGSKILIAVMAIIIVGLSGYIVYDKVIQNNDKEEEKKEVEVLGTYKEEDIKKVTEGIEGFFLEHDELSDFNNKNRLLYAFSLLRDQDSNGEKDYFTNGFTSQELREVYEKSVLGKIKYQDDDIYLSPGYNELYWHYNQGRYTFEPMAAHGAWGYYPIYRYLKDYQVVGKKYIISYQYVFSLFMDGPNDEMEVYYTIDDAKKQINSFKSFEISNYFKDEFDEAVYDERQKDMTKYFEEHKNDLMEKLAVYTYTYEESDDGLKLVDFNRK